MNCCENCFEDEEIVQIIRSGQRCGDCDFCGARDVLIYNLDQGNDIEELFNNVLDIYTPINVLPCNFPRMKTDLIKNIIHDKWGFFNRNFNNEDVYRMLTGICKRRYEIQPDLFDSPVGIKEIEDHTVLAENAILKGGSWKEFVEDIKYKSRFHGNYLNLTQLLKFVNCTKVECKKGEVFFRSRVCDNPEGYSSDQMGAPPKDKVKSGRLNPEGISVLYLSDDPETTFYEVRAGVYDYVSLGKFELLKDISVADLTRIDQISPFVVAQSQLNIDLFQYAINIDCLRQISAEIARPLRFENVLDYLPTQYICDFIRSNGFDGVRYKSVMREGVGNNLAVFDETNLQCINVEVHDVSHISYSHNKCK